MRASRTEIPVDAIPLHEAYWKAVREVFPFMNVPQSGGAGFGKPCTGSDCDTSEQEWKLQVKVRRALDEFDKRWRLSLAGSDPMTGGSSTVMLPIFVTHPETQERLSTTEARKWLDPDEEIRGERTLPVRTTNGEINRTFLTTTQAVDRLIKIMRKDFPRDLAAIPQKHNPIPLDTLKKWLCENVDQSKPEAYWRDAAQHAYPQYKIPKSRWRKAWSSVPASQKRPRGRPGHRI